MWDKLALAALMGASMGAVLAAPCPAWAQEAPDAEAVRRAKNEFDEGSRAYRAEHWELAASHFEAADEAVPSERALRMAIRARQKAGQGARAATLAAAALRRYPDDEKTAELGREVLDELSPGLHELTITCEAPCTVTVGTRVVPGRRAESWTIYLEPGPARLSAAFESGGPASHELEAAAGQSSEVSVAPVAEVAPAPAPAPAPVTPPPGQPEIEPPEEADESSFIEHPGVFIAGLVATAGLGGVTIWSGIDTLEEPGTETVREECRGEGPDCPEYQLGLEKQLRTNILIGATATVGLLTGIIGIAVTDWGGEDVEANALIGPDSGILTLRGRF